MRESRHGRSCRGTPFPEEVPLRSASGLLAAPDASSRYRTHAGLSLLLKPQATESLDLPPNTVLFRQGDSSDSGIYIVVEGSLGVYVQARLHGFTQARNP